MSLTEQATTPTSTQEVHGDGLAWWQAGLAGILVAAVANLVIYAIGRGAGASFDVVDRNTEFTVNAGTVLMFTAVPMALGFVLAVVASRRWPWALRAGEAIGIALALVTIALPFAADTDGGTQAALAVMHVGVAAGLVLAFEAYRRHRIATTAT